jgi:hypothetical protein
MTLEEKLKEAKRLYQTANPDQRYVLETLIPELKESEGESMVKFIKNQLFNIKKTVTDNYELDAKLTKAIEWLEKQAQSTTITIPKDLKGTDTDGGVVGEQGEQPTEEEMVGMGELGKVWNEQAIISRLDKIIELLTLNPPHITPYIPTIIYGNPLNPDPNTLGGWKTWASTCTTTDDKNIKIQEDETSKPKS